MKANTIFVGKKAMCPEKKQKTDCYEIETELTVKGLKNGFIFQEIPISCRKREYNISKLKILSDSLKIFKTILKSATKNNY